MAAALAVTLAGGAAAQDTMSTPEGQPWALEAYSGDDGLVAVPDGLAASLLLMDGTASGSGGCNRFSGSYQIDGNALTIAPEMGVTLVACAPEAEELEAAYLALLPTTASWQATETGLQLLNGDGSTILEYSAAAEVDLAAILAQLVALRAELGDLQGRVEALEAGGGEQAGGGDDGADAQPGGGSEQASAPRRPRSRGKVETTFPAWLRENKPIEEVEDPNREIVRWRDRANDEDGYRVYARRGYCELRPGTNPNQDLDEGDFRLARNKARLIEDLPAGTDRYRPDHAAIDAMLPAAPSSPYSNDQFYDVLVTAFNEAGESRRVKVASFYLTPEFRCP
jgi:heat shock protein HslJ